MSCWLVTIELNKNVSYFLFANRLVDWCVRSLIRTAVIWITDRTIQPNERNELVCFLHSDTNRISYSVQRQFAIECYSFLGICSLCLFSIHTEMCLFAVNECIETSGFEWTNKKTIFYACAFSLLRLQTQCSGMRKNCLWYASFFPPVSPRSNNIECAKTAWATVLFYLHPFIIDVLSWEWKSLNHERIMFIRWCIPMGNDDAKPQCFVRISTFQAFAYPAHSHRWTELIATIDPSWTQENITVILCFCWNKKTVDDRNWWRKVPNLVCPPHDEFAVPIPSKYWWHSSRIYFGRRNEGKAMKPPICMR